MSLRVILGVHGMNLYNRRQTETGGSSCERTSRNFSWVCHTVRRSGPPRERDRHAVEEEPMVEHEGAYREASRCGISASLPSQNTPTNGLNDSKKRQ
jgi:hypothetical protein